MMVWVMRGRREPWVRTVGCTLALGVAIFGVVRLAIANPGVAGGPARSSVTVAGTLTGVSGTPSATFHFRDGAAEMCSPPPRVVIANLDPATRAFSAEVPIDNCAGLFDGSDVSVTVDVNETSGVVSSQTINPVPYAHFASSAGRLDSLNYDFTPTSNAFTREYSLPAPEGPTVTAYRLLISFEAAYGRGCSSVGQASIVGAEFLLLDTFGYLRTTQEGSVDVTTIRNRSWNTGPGCTASVSVTGGPNGQIRISVTNAQGALVTCRLKRDG